MTRYDIYDPKSIGRVEENLMRILYYAPAFLFWILWDPHIGMAFKIILASPIDEHEDHQRLKNENLTSTLDPSLPWPTSGRSAIKVYRKALHWSQISGKYF